MVQKSGESKKHSGGDNDKERFWLYLRLFLIMGVVWSTEILSWILDDVTWIFYIVDILNCLQGVVIFVSFVWTRKVKRLIQKR